LGYFVIHSGRAGFLTTVSAISPSQGQLEGGEPVYQPSSIDAGTLRSSDAIGQVEDFTIYNLTGSNVVDAALVILREGIETSGNVLPSFPALAFGKSSLSAPGSPQDISLGQQVAKVGRTTGYTVGTLTSVALSNLRVRAGRHTLVYKDLLEIQSDEAFSRPGDSGALVFTIPDLVPIGLVVASTSGREGTRNTFACSLERAVEFFDVTPM
jgi:hypothetical protein